jgi:hypothetical protein
MMTDYKQTKNAVLETYEKFLPLAERAKNGQETTYDNLLESLAKQAENIRQDKFLLMVVGEAKSGKSTFINAYLGAEILPMDVKQCTSAIVEIRYGTKFILKATYAGDNVVTIEDEQEIKSVLTQNAAIDDKYRDIPVSVINIEILMDRKGNKVPEAEIRDFMKGIQNENLYHLPTAEYERKVRAYIKEKQPHWKELVKKIEIEYPFKDPDLKGIEIVDTPGVNAEGRVGDITNQYIEEANAVMFLKPIVGAALEATSFKRFLNSKSADRNKEAMFLILTRAANETEENVDRILEEARRQFPGIHEKQIIAVDSKAQLFYNRVQDNTVEEIQAMIMDLNQRKKLDSFVLGPWVSAGGDRERFLQELRGISHFDVVDDALNLFAHKAQYLALDEFLGHLMKATDRIRSTLDEKIDLYEQKAIDPYELANKLNKTKGELNVLTNKLHNGVSTVINEYSKTDGIIDKEAKKVFVEYQKEIDSLNDSDPASMDELEKISFRKIDYLTEFERKLQNEIVGKCDEVLITLSNKSGIQYTTLKPDLTKESFEKIKEELKKSNEATEYRTGRCFRKVRQFSKVKYFRLVRNDIRGRMDNIKNQAVTDLKKFVQDTTSMYSDELTKNTRIKEKEYNDIQKEQENAEDIQKKIGNLKDLRDQLTPVGDRVQALKGGIEGNVR